MFINKTLPINNFKIRTARNTKISLFVICVETIIYLLLYKMHDYTFDRFHSRGDTPKSIHCVKSVRIWSYSGPHFSSIFPHSNWIRRDTDYLFVFSPNAGKCGKNANQNNSEYGFFLRRDSLRLVFLIISQNSKESNWGRIFFLIKKERLSLFY